MKNDKVHFKDHKSERIFGGYKSKVVHHKMVFQIGVSFFIRCILEHTKCHLVDFLRKRATNFNLIEIE